MSWYPTPGAPPPTGTYPPVAYPQQAYPPPGYPQPQYQLPVRQRHEGYKTAAIILFAIGFFLHMLTLIPVIGILFGVIGAITYVVAFILLCMI